MKIQWDDRELQAAMQLYARATGKTGAQVVNRACRNWAGRAIQFTEKAAIADINNAVNSPYWWKMIWKRLGRGHTKAEAKALSNKILAARRKSAGFIKSGWMEAFRAFAAATGLTTTTRGSAKQYGKPKGEASIAREALRAEGILVNLAGNTKSSSSGQALQKYGVPAFQAAAAFVAKDMREYALQRFQEYGSK